MMEKELKFTKIKITNFRNINELEIDFKNDFTEISGKNGLGKTNTLSAIMWCLFGKNIYDEKLFTISPIIDGEENNSINTIVKLVINDNYVIERSYKDRKTNLKTGWIIDGKEELVAITQTKYNQELIENFIDEETFKSLSNINYIPNLNWRDLKKLIFDLIGNIEDDEVLLRDDFELIEEYVRKFGIDETQRLLKQTDSELNEDIKRLETEYQTLLNTKEKYVVGSEENVELEKRKKEIEDILYANQKDIENYQNELYNYNTAKRQEIQLKSEIESIESHIKFYEEQAKEFQELYNSASFDIESARTKEQLELNNCISQLKIEKQNIESNIIDINKNIEELRNTGEELKSIEIKIENDKCSTCGQQLPPEQIEEILNQLRNEHQEKIINIKKDYDDKKDLKQKLEENLSLRIKWIEEKEKELELTKTKTYENVEETDKQKQIRVKKESYEIEIKKSEEILETLTREYSLQQEKNKNLIEPKAVYHDNENLKNELNELNNRLATTITLNKISEDVESTMQELNNKKDNKLANKEKLSQVVKFNNIKADLLQKKVRQYFDLVNFRTKEYNQNGEEVETFKIVNDKNVEFKEINTGNKILLGVDLIKGIQKAKKLNIPIIIDNFETLTSEINNIDNQIIVARAIKGKESLEVK